jgi:hypothetical protein
MFNIPIPGGTTGHAVGAGIIAILLGPWTALLAVSVVLIIQAIVFGDGGITKTYTVRVEVRSKYDGLIAYSYNNTQGVTFLDPLDNLLAVTPSGSTVQSADIYYDGDVFAANFPGLTDNETLRDAVDGLVRCEQGRDQAPMELKAGDRILFATYAGTEVKPGSAANGGDLILTIQRRPNGCLQRRVAPS